MAPLRANWTRALLLISTLVGIQAVYYQPTALKPAEELVLLRRIEIPTPSLARKLTGTL